MSADSTIWSSTADKDHIAGTDAPAPSKGRRGMVLSAIFLTSLAVVGAGLVAHNGDAPARGAVRPTLPPATTTTALPTTTRPTPTTTTQTIPATVAVTTAPVGTDAVFLACHVNELGFTWLSDRPCGGDIFHDPPGMRPSVLCRTKQLDQLIGYPGVRYGDPVVITAEVRDTCRTSVVTYEACYYRVCPEGKPDPPS